MALGGSKSCRGLTETASTVLAWNTAETILSADTIVNLIVHDEVWCIRRATCAIVLLESR